MSYSIRAAGTKPEIQEAITRQTVNNNSAELSAVKEALKALLESVEGNDKRLFVNCTGAHYSGMIFHNWTIETTSTGSTG